MIWPLTFPACPDVPHKYSKLIVMRLEIVVSYAPILDCHVFGKKTGAVTLSQMGASNEVGRQESPGLRVPVHAAAADAVWRHESAPGTDRQRGLVHLVAEREGRLLGPKEQFVADAVAQFVGRIARRIIGGRIAPRPSLDRDHVESGFCQLISHDRAGPAEPDNHDVLCRQFARHSQHSGFVGEPVCASCDADRRMRITLVVAADPVAIVVANAGKADHLPADHVRDCRHGSDRRKILPARPSATRRRSPAH